MAFNSDAVTGSSLRHGTGGKRYFLICNKYAFNCVIYGF